MILTSLAILLALAVVCLTCILAVQARAVLARLARQDALPMPSPRAEDNSGILERLQAIEADRELLRAAVAEGINHVERVEKRIQGTIRRARKEFANSGFQHEGLDAEASEFSVVDGESGQGSRVPFLPEIVDDARSSVQGVSKDQLARVRR